MGTQIRRKGGSHRGYRNVSRPKQVKERKEEKKKQLHRSPKHLKSSLHQPPIKKRGKDKRTDEWLIITSE